MKKLSALLIAISFCILSAGNVLANDSQVNVVDRHAVWTNWFDENGNRLPDTIAKMRADRMKPERASKGESIQAGMGGGMGEKGNKFDFIQETKSYDYTRDKGRTT